MEFAQLVTSYDLPVDEVNQDWPEMRRSRTAHVVAHRVRAALRRGRRLAYLDSTFPWQRSGFRYHEAAALLELAPDTLFFSMWKLTDPFPATVHPLSEFPTIAVQADITDAYGVFQLFLAGLLGLHSTDPASRHPMAGFDISSDLRQAGITLHGSIYPGGGFTSTPEGLDMTRKLVARLGKTFSYVPEVLANVPGITPVAQAFTETRFYEQSDDRWGHDHPIQCLFAGDAPPRKGLEVVLRAFRDLPAADFHLHVVGPHTHRREELSDELATFHGWLSPDELRELHRKIHIFVSPVSAEAPGAPGTFTGVTDGFPTQAAADAMSSGCLLISANPARDHRVLTPGVHYLDCEPTPDLVRQLLEHLVDEKHLMRDVAEAGSEQVRERMDIRRGTAVKLAHMGFLIEP
jgi:glycosyltransferase involved in cell wall biosynthesis